MAARNINSVRLAPYAVEGVYQYFGLETWV